MTDPKDMTDNELIKAFLATDGQPDNEWATALADEIERRGLDL